MSTEKIDHTPETFRYLYQGAAPVVAMQAFFEHLPTEDKPEDEHVLGTVHHGDEVAFYEPLPLDALAHADEPRWLPADQHTADIVAAQLQVLAELEPEEQEEAPDEAAAPAPPDGTVDELLAWVDEDPHGRVALATDHEAAREGGPRKRAIDQLAHRASSLSTEG